MLYVGVVRCEIRLKYIPVAAVRLSRPVSNSVSIEGFVAQLPLLARGWDGRLVRSKRGFGLPGDCSEMSLSFL